MKTIVHKANTRGSADHGWLKSKHTFSFANYYNPERMGFGALRVINDDHVEGGMGFGTHPHRDMEIISIPTSGKLAHKDTIGTNGIIESGEIQVMSAGTGIAHSEMNGQLGEPVKFFQIWVMPNKQGVEPRYQQLKIADMLKPNEFGQILSPDPDDAGVWIHQDAWFHMGNLDKGVSANYELKGNQHGVYAFVIEGKVKIGDEILETRDGMGIVDTRGFEVEALEDSRVLLMEVPM